MVCASHKNYEYKTINSLTGDSKTGCKVRRITLNYSVSLLVNFAKMKDMILTMDDNETLIVRTKNKIKRKRDRGEVSIISQLEEKT
jgi:hypothetical protein